MKFLRVGVVIFGALIITALGIDAADTIEGNSGTMLGQLIATEVATCPSGMIEVPAGFGFTCADMYEASPNEMCEHKIVRSQLDTTANLLHTECAPVSEQGRTVWNFVSRDEAQLLCLRAGKRLPSNEEWQNLALGTQDQTDVCNTDAGVLANSGVYDTCASAVGVLDMIGNAWEWTSDEVVAGQYQGRLMPDSGYISLADRTGIAVETTAIPSEQYGNDYFWGANEETVTAIMRGGFYGSDDDAGVYTAHAGVPSSMRGVAIGFRCVQ